MRGEELSKMFGTEPDGIFSNGDLWYGETEREENGETWYMAEGEGGEYQTKERPERFPLFAMTIFPDGTPESFAREYMLAKKTGDEKFGLDCQHSRAKHGYCPDCLRKII